MSDKLILIIIGMGIATYIPRWAPLFLFAGRRFPPLLKDFLDFIPAAILGALVLPSLITVGDPRQVSFDKADLWAAIPTLLVALKTKSLAGTVITGMASYFLATGYFHY